MKTENNKFVYYSVLIMICIPFIFYWTGVHDLFSSPLSIGITTVIIISCVIKEYNIICNSTDVFFLLINLPFLFLSVILYEGLGAILTFCNLIGFLLLFNNLRFTKKQVQCTRLAITILLLIFIMSLKIKQNYQSIIIHDVKGNLINPNTFGLLTTAIYFHTFLLIDSTIKQKPGKFIALTALTCISLKYIYLSDCRSALGSVILFLIFYTVKIVHLKNYKRMLSYIVIAALVIPIIYIQILPNIRNVELFGKSLTTRNLVWKSTIDFIKTHPILGCGTKSDILMMAREYTASAHNVFLGIWKTIGIVPMLTLMIYLQRGENIAHISAQNDTSKRAFLCSMAICIFETMLNDSDTYIFFITLLLTIQENSMEDHTHDT